jgi:hypothetical protein
MTVSHSIGVGLPSVRRGRALDTGACHWPSLESAFTYRAAAVFACSVRAGLQSRQGGIDLHNVPLHLSDEGSDLGSLECDRCSFGVVLIIGVAVPRGRNHGLEVMRQAR